MAPVGKMRPFACGSRGRAAWKTGGWRARAGRLDGKKEAELRQGGAPHHDVGAVLFRLIGIAVYRRGKRVGRPRTKWLGVALMLYPYATPQTWLLYLVGAALCLWVFIDRD